MKEVKTPKKPLAYYYGIVLIVLIVFNLVNNEEKQIGIV